MSKKSTKKALLLSVLSLLACVAMLVSTTFAWFTDSVASANNVIKSGNLDIELEYWNGTEWLDVTDATDILTNDLFEPGVVEVAYLRLANVGSLALKYAFGVNIISETSGVNQANASFNLSDYIEFGVIEGVNGESAAYADRKAAVADIIGAKAIKEGYVSESTSLLAGNEQYLALVVYMPESVDNVANHNGINVPQIDLGINVLATQYTYEEDSFDETYDKDAFYADHYVTNADELKAAIAAGGIVGLMNDVTVEETITIPNGKTVTIDLNGKTLTGYAPNNTANADMFLVKGDLTIKNGSVEYSVANNLGWGAMSAILDITAGGVANIEDATLFNLGGTDMAFVAHLNNWGTATLNVNNSEMYSPYAAVRVFNSGYDMNNVTISNSTIAGSNMALWVHNYTAADFGSADKAASQAQLLNLNFEDNNNILMGKIRYGFTDAVVVDSTKTLVIADDNNELKNALADNATVVLNGGEYSLTSLSGKTGITIIGTEDTVIGGEGATTGFGGNFGKDTVIKNVTFSGSSNGVRWSYAQGGDTVFENCVFAGDSVYGFHIDESKGANFTFNNCTFSGFNAFAGDLASVTFNGCTFLHNGNYGHTNIWSVGYFNNCTFGENVTYGGSGTIYVDGVQL